MKTIGFIGVGNMGGPMFRAALAAFGADEVTFTCATEAHRRQMEQESGVTAAKDNETLAKECRYVVLAVKPQYAPAVYPQLTAIGDGQTLISVMAGVSIETLQAAIGKPIPVIRMMPNTPAAIGAGMTAVSYSKEADTPEHKAFATQLCGLFGAYAEIPEAWMHAAVCASGSSPAFVYLFLEAMADGVVKCGIPRKLAYEMVAQTVLGSAKLFLESGKHPGELKDAVCSPQGTTVAAVAALEEHGFRNALLKACEACYQRSVELGESEKIF